MNRLIRLILLALAVAAKPPSSLSAQPVAALTMRYGTGGGFAPNVIELSLRARIRPPVYGMGAYEVFGEERGPCPNPADYACAYFGRSMSLGAAVALVDTQRRYLGTRILIGEFTNTTGIDHGSRSATVNVGADGEVKLLGAFRFHAGLSYRHIFDATYRERVGKTPRFVAAVAGLSITF